MSKSRNLADLLDANGDVKASGLDNVPPSNDASALTTGTLDSGRLPSSGVNASSLTTGTLPVDRVPYLGRRNLFINGDFQVWQRGTSFSSLSSKTYTADRWYTFNGSLSKGTQVMPEGYTTNSLDWVYTSSSGTQLWQGVEEGHSTVKDKACTLSVVLSCTSGTMSINPAFNGASITSTVWNVTTTPTRFTYSRSASDNSGLNGTTLYTGLNIVNGSTGTLKISEFQLELGSVATPFEHRSFGEELALCQRYYWKTYAYAEAPGTLTNTGVLGRFIDGTHSYASIQVPSVNMRATPTKTVYNPNTGATGSLRSDSNTHPASTTSIGSNGNGWIFASGSSISTSVSCKAHLVLEAEL